MAKLQARPRKRPKKRALFPLGREARKILTALNAANALDHLSGEEQRFDFVTCQILISFGINPARYDTRSILNILRKRGFVTSDEGLRASIARLSRNADARNAARIHARNESYRDALAAKIGYTRSDRLLRVCLESWPANDPIFAALPRHEQLARVLESLLANHGIKTTQNPG